MIRSVISTHLRHMFRWLKSDLYVSFINLNCLAQFGGGALIPADLRNKTNKQQGKTPADSNKTAGLGASYVVSQKCFWWWDLPLLQCSMLPHKMGRSWNFSWPLPKTWMSILTGEHQCLCRLHIITTAWFCSTITGFLCTFREIYTGCILNRLHSVITFEPGRICPRSVLKWVAFELVAGRYLRSCGIGPLAGQNWVLASLSTNIYCFRIWLLFGLLCVDLGSWDYLLIFVPFIVVLIASMSSLGKQILKGE